MKILIVSTFFPPLNSIASLRPYSWAKEWTKLGQEVTVLTTKKQQDETVALKLEQNGFRTIEISQATFLNRLKSSYATGSNGQGGLSSLFHKARHRFGIFNACRMPDFSDLWINPALQAIKNEGPFDVVVSTAGPYSVHILAYLLKRKGIAKKWVADYRDTWSDNYFYPGIFPFNLIEKALEWKILRSADTVTSVSDPFTQCFAKKHKKESVATVPNGFDPDDLSVIDGKPAFPEDGKFRIIHTGSIYLGKRDPSPLFQAIAELNESHYQKLNSLEVIFVGSNQANLESLINTYGVQQWVKLNGFVSREKALAMQRDAHALLFLPWNDPNVDGILTGKIFEYLYAKTPIITVGATQMEQSQQMILDANAGETFHSVDKIKAYLIKQLHQPKKQKSNTDESFLKNYDRAVIAQNFLELINR